MITRRKALIGLATGVLAAPLVSFAQQQRSKVARIGLLEPASASGYSNWWEALIAGLRELGHTEGKNITSTAGQRGSTNAWRGWRQSWCK
jgi:hypothetical protein